MHSGERYGKLTLIQPVPRPDGKSRKGSYWLCKCDCGNECIKHYNDIWAGDTKSCGCLSKRAPIYDKSQVEVSNHAGIYGFQNRYNGHWYIGKAHNLYRRYCQHRNDWKQHQEKQFYQAIKKYGWDGFNYFILKEYADDFSEQQMSQDEEFFIVQKDAYKNGYNASERSSGGFYSAEQREKCIQVLNRINAQQKNENHPRTTFSKTEIEQIFNYAMQGAPARWVYEQYTLHNITYESFKAIYRGEHFKDYLPQGWTSRPVVATNAKLWGSWVSDIKKRYLNGESIERIHHTYQDKASLLDIRRICHNQTYKQIQPCID